MSIIMIFAIVFIIGLIGSIHAYAQPSARSWQVAFIIIVFIGGLGSLVAFIISSITGD